jgi:hypothetical protein
MMPAGMPMKSEKKMRSSRSQATKNITPTKIMKEIEIRWARLRTGIFSTGNNYGLPQV